MTPKKKGKPASLLHDYVILSVQLTCMFLGFTISVLQIYIFVADSAASYLFSQMRRPSIYGDIIVQTWFAL